MGISPAAHASGADVLLTDHDISQDRKKAVQEDVIPFESRFRDEEQMIMMIYGRIYGPV